ncbi:MAG: guanylate kinase [Dysgonamonadaceae bacterium]|jgi:guanylate kinase|nr:guanylate kinase [Dysgonamonadaceae bacterium]
MNGKLVIISAPSGSGKTTIISYILKQGLNLQFAVSATSRKPRGREQHGVEYYFISQQEFIDKIARGEFLEYEEVYPGLFYGTLKSEINRIFSLNGNVIFDVDVAGGCSIKNHYKDQALSIFIQPPSIVELKRRLENRGTEDPAMIEKRLIRAKEELEFAAQFDKIIVNDDLSVAKKLTLTTVKNFLDSI